MVPYFEVPPLHIGPIALQSFGVLAAAGVAVASWLLVREAARRRLDTQPMRDFAPWAVVGGVIGDHLMHLFVYHPEELHGPRCHRRRARRDFVVLPHSCTTCPCQLPILAASADEPVSCAEKLLNVVSSDPIYPRAPMHPFRRPRLLSAGFEFEARRQAAHGSIALTGRESWPKWLWRMSCVRRLPTAGWQKSSLKRS